MSQTDRQNIYRIVAQVRMRGMFIEKNQSCIIIRGEEINYRIDAHM